MVAGATVDPGTMLSPVTMAGLAAAVAGSGAPVTPDPGGANADIIIICWTTAAGIIIHARVAGLYTVHIGVGAAADGAGRCAGARPCPDAKTTVGAGCWPWWGATKPPALSICIGATCCIIWIGGSLGAADTSVGCPCVMGGGAGGGVLLIVGPLGQPPSTLQLPGTGAWDICAPD